MVEVNTFACAFATYIANSAPPTPAKKLETMIFPSYLFPYIQAYLLMNWILQS
jgi:hypothetical protein